MISSDVPFWPREDATTRRTFLMPLSNPSEFLAFGVLGPSNKVLFVTRGKVCDHLGDFTARMVRAGASVEFHARPPLPESILKEYTSFDITEAEKPLPPSSSQEFSSEGSLWPEEDTNMRQAIFVPLPSPDEFLAFGVFGESERLAFVAKGRVRDHLGYFIARMMREGARVGLYTRPPQPHLRKYISNHFPRVSASRSRSSAPETGSASGESHERAA